MEHDRFFELIKAGGLSGAYLLHGEEEYVKDSALAAVYALVEDTARELNIQSAETVESIIAACETLPFFAERRVVVSHTIPTGDEGAKLRDYLQNLPPTALLIFFIRGGADSTTAIYKALAKEDRAVLFAPLTGPQAARWLVQQCNKRDVSMAQSAASFMVELVGSDLGALKNEFEKAAAYAGEGQEITREHISASVTRNLEFRVFDVVDYILAGKTADGLRALDILVKDGEDPLKLSALLSSRLKLMLTARECIDDRLTRNDAVKRMGGSAFAAGKAFDAAKHYNRELLIRYIQAFANVQYSSKLSSAANRFEMLQTALISCSMKG